LRISNGHNNLHPKRLLYIRSHTSNARMPLRSSWARDDESDQELQDNIRAHKEGEVCKKEVEQNFGGDDQGCAFLETDARRMPFQEGMA